MLTAVCLVIPALESWPGRAAPGVQRELLEGRVVSVVARYPYGEFTAELLEVEYEGRRIVVDRLRQPNTASAFEVRPGDTIVFFETRGPDGTTYQFRDRSRKVPLLLLGGLFVVFVVIVGGWQGVSSLVGLAAGVLVVGRFVLPGLLAGADPVLLCIVGAITIMAATLTLGHGASRKTAIAFIATSACLVLAGFVANAAVDLAALSGLAGDDELNLSRLARGIDMRGLLLGGIILGAVGVLDDVTTTQASAVIELHRTDPALTRRELFRRAMRIGRDHIAASTNTLFLAYTGAALPLLVILTDRGLAPHLVVSFETLAVEIIRTLAGSIAVVAAVPASSGIAALMVGRGPAQAEGARGGEDEARRLAGLDPTRE